MARPGLLGLALLAAVPAVHRLAAGGHWPQDLQNIAFATFVPLVLPCRALQCVSRCHAHAYLDRTNRGCWHSHSDRYCVSRCDRKLACVHGLREFQITNTIQTHTKRESSHENKNAGSWCVRLFARPLKLYRQPFLEQEYLIQGLLPHRPLQRLRRTATKRTQQRLGSNKIARRCRRDRKHLRRS